MTDHHADRLLDWARTMLESEPPPVGLGPFVTTEALRLTTDDRIRALLHERRRQGVERYGVALRAWNGRRVVHDLVQELTDALLYATQLRMETGDDGPRRQVEALLGLLLTMHGRAP